MKALITGASSGIGKEMAIYLGGLGYDLILVARSKDKLLELKNNINTNVKILEYDLSDNDNCFKLYEEIKNEKIDIVINNAGFGLFGDYENSDLNVIIVSLFMKNFEEITAINQYQSFVLAL